MGFLNVQMIGSLILVPSHGLFLLLTSLVYLQYDSYFKSSILFCYISLKRKKEGRKKGRREEGKE